MQLIETRTLSHLHQFNQTAVALLREQLGRLHFIVRVPYRNQVKYRSLVQEVFLPPKLLESHLLPLVCVKGEHFLVVDPRRKHPQTTSHHNGVQTGHEKAGAELDPAFFGVGDDHDHGVLEALLDQLDGLVLYGREGGRELVAEPFVLVVINRVQVRGREQGVVPVEYHEVLAALRLLHWREPYLLTGQTAQVVHPHFGHDVVLGGDLHFLD